MCLWIVHNNIRVRVRVMYILSEVINEFHTLKQFVCRIFLQLAHEKDLRLAQNFCP